MHTVSDALAHALEAAGHRCDNQVIRATPLARLWKAASQADVTIATHNSCQPMSPGFWANGTENR